MTKNYCWPDDFIDGIPPRDSVPAQGYVYRLVRNNPPIESDFQRTVDQYPDREFKSDAEKFKSYGVSVFTKLNALKNLRVNFPDPEQFGDTMIAGGEMVAELGVTQPKPDKKGHLTLWKQNGAKPHLHISNCED